MGVFMPKNTFFEGTKKISVQNIFWDFLYMYKRWLVQKNTDWLISYFIPLPYYQIFIQVAHYTREYDMVL